MFKQMITKRDSTSSFFIFGKTRGKYLNVAYTLYFDQVVCFISFMKNENNCSSQLLHEQLHNVNMS